MKIGFIGAGHMATGIIRGLLKTDLAEKEDIYLTASTPARSEEVAASIGVQWSPSNLALIPEVDLVVLAVKPQLLPPILAEIADSLVNHHKPVVSIAAGLTLAKLASYFAEGSQPQVLRAMPNMNVTVGQGVTGIAANEHTTPESLEATERLFQTVGSTYLLAEKDFQNFTAIAGCSPAYTYLYIDALARGGVKNGLPKELATKIATEAVLGSAAMLQHSSQETPWDLIDKVCSPGGTTIAGLVSLEQDAFTGTIIRALDATITRDNDLGQ